MKVMAGEWMLVRQANEVLKMAEVSLTETTSAEGDNMRFDVCVFLMYTQIYIYL